MIRSVICQLILVFSLLLLAACDSPNPTSKPVGSTVVPPSPTPLMPEDGIVTAHGEGINYAEWRGLTGDIQLVSWEMSSLCFMPPGVFETVYSPHFVPAVRYFVNAAADRRLARSGAEPFEVGSVIVKEKWVLRPAVGEDPRHVMDVSELRGGGTTGPAAKARVVTRAERDAIGKSRVRGADDKLLAYAAMIKRQPGYDPSNGDWEYLYAELEGEKNVYRGRIKTCIDCHATARAGDFVFHMGSMQFVEDVQVPLRHDLATTGTVMIEQFVPK